MKFTLLGLIITLTALLPNLAQANTRGLNLCTFVFSSSQSRIDVGSSNPAGYVSISGRKQGYDPMYGTPTSSSPVLIEAFQDGTAVVNLTRTVGRTEVNTVQVQMSDPGNPSPENRVIVTLEASEINGKIQTFKMIKNSGLENPLWGIKLLLDVFARRGADLDDVNFDFVHENYFLVASQFSANSVRNAIKGPSSTFVDVARELFKLSTESDQRTALASVLYLRSSIPFDHGSEVKGALLEGFKKYKSPGSDFRPTTEAEWNYEFLSRVMQKAIQQHDYSWLIREFPRLSPDTYFLFNNVMKQLFIEEYPLPSSPTVLKNNGQLQDFKRIVEEFEKLIQAEIQNFKETPGYQISPFFMRTLIFFSYSFFPDRGDLKGGRRDFFVEVFGGPNNSYLHYLQLLSKQMEEGRGAIGFEHWWVSTLIQRALFGETSTSLEVSLRHVLDNSRQNDLNIRQRDAILRILREIY